MAISNPGGNLNSVPAAIQQALQTNYLDLSSATNAGWGQQYVPDLMEKEAEVFGPRTISGFLSQVGAEEAMTADQVVWSEQGRLHLSYKCEVKSTTTIEIQSDIDGNNSDTTDGISGSGNNPINHGVRVNDTIIISDSTNGVVKALVVVVANDLITVAPYEATALTGTTAALATTILVYGSEYGKGTRYDKADGTFSDTDSRGANEPSVQTFTNKPIIMKDYYEVSGSDASRIGWIEVSSEGGASGYLWYLKAEADTRARFNDYLEMSMLEAVPSATDGSNTTADTQLNMAAAKVGTQGLFDAIEDRGNITTGVTGVNAATDLAEFDAILAEFDSQGAIEENMMFVNRATSLAMDDMLASMNSYGAGGTSYGVFNNSEDMALNLGFSGFRRGSYDFYKSDFRYLNDKATRGGINAANAANAIRGVMIPAGTSSVYDQTVGASIKRPFLHVRYRASQTDDRRMKTWTTGSVGAATSALDAMQIHMLSERCLITQGANNFMLLK
jgi:hypothetical protein